MKTRLYLTTAVELRIANNLKLFIYLIFIGKEIASMFLVNQKTSTMKTIYFVAILAMLSMTSCFTPKPVIRLKADEPKTTWDKGKEYISYKMGEYEVHTSYFGCDNNNLIFDIEVVNVDGEEFLVAPENIKLHLGQWNNAAQNVSFGNAISAIDPEMQLLKFDLEASKAEAASKNAGIAAVGIFAAAIPLAIVAAKSDADNEKNNKQSDVSNTELVSTGVNLALTANEVNQNLQEIKIQSMNDSKYYWETASLRKTTLSPGYSIRGLVYFPIPEMKFRKLKLDIPVPTGSISVKYDLLVYFPQ